jgi:GTPase SAR1 family protein
VIIGDGACGKTSLLSVFTLGYFPTVSLGRHITRLSLPHADMP